MEYRRLQAKSDDKPRAVVVSLDETELTKFRKLLEDCDSEEMETYQNLVAAQAEGMQHHGYEFTIPGNEVGEISDLTYDIDNGKLENLVETWNQEMIDELPE